MVSNGVLQPWQSRTYIMNLVRDDISTTFETGLRLHGFLFLFFCPLACFDVLTRLADRAKKYAFIASLLLIAQTRLPLVNPPVSKPWRPLKDSALAKHLNDVQCGLRGVGRCRSSVGLLMFFLEAAEFFLRRAL